MSASDARCTRRLLLGIQLIVLLCAGYFFGGASDNQRSRLYAMYTFVEPGTDDTGTFRIDRFRQPHGRSDTVDWAFHDGHYYSNKAPGSIWLGTLAYAPLVLFERALDVSYAAPRVALVDAYLINLAVSVLPLVLGAGAMFSLASSLGAGPVHAAWVALATTLGTLWFPYSTQLWGHTTAAAWTALALVQVQRATPRSALLAGLTAGLAVCTDYLAIISALAVTVWLALRRPRLLPQLALGALPALLGLLTYHALCFGNPLATASQMSNPKVLSQGLALGMFGTISLPALWKLTLGVDRGLFVHCPVLLLSALGFCFWIKRAPREPLPYVCILAFVAYLAANASFNGWHGGATVGARYLICALPFLGIALATLPRSAVITWLAAGLTALSTLNMLAIAAVSPLAPENHANPLYAHTYAFFFQGALTPWALAIRGMDLDPSWPRLKLLSMCNLGELLGLSGLASLLPLLGAVLAVAVMLLNRSEPSA
ncbi:MAG TPA: hypothetical protein VJR89_24970 [Polyangiales bacterium]|nr:hypothetical protein [Polyangiales bacterium]